jgi:hypothetical protein
MLEKRIHVEHLCSQYKMQGRVYRIQSRVDGCFYIGSTRLSIEKRLSEHRICRARRTHRAIPVYAYFNLKGWENAEITLVREFETITDEELLWEERREIERALETYDVRCLNKNRPIITDEELKEQVRVTHQRWQRENKEHVAEALREWRLANPEKVREQNARRQGHSKEYSKVYHQEHRDHIREKTRQWRLDNPEKYAEQCRRANERAKEKRAAQKTI